MSASPTPLKDKVAIAPPGPARARIPLFTADAWAPLKVELFRSLWIATSIAQIGTWAREAAGPWLMQILTNGWKTQPEMVARVLVFSNLPICLFSVFAGALADVLDRRRLLIVTQIWMVIVSALLGLLTLYGFMTPWGLLGLTFLLGAGTAAFGPALQAVLPELVPRQHFALAINMNSVALNVARAVGPGLFILVVSFLHGTTGVGVSFLLTAASFLAAIWVLWRWKRPPQRAAIHGEEMWGAIYAGYRYTIHSPANRAILLRVLTFIVPAVVMWSQVPIIATRQLNMGEQSYALLFAFVGIGAVFGVFLMPGLHGRYKIDPVVNVCTALFALGLIALSRVHTLWEAAFIMIFLGINWVIIPTNFNTATQKSVPSWVKGRAISFYLTVLFGSFAIGGAIWGRVTEHTSISTALLLGGTSMLAMLSLAYWFPLTLNEGLDLSPAYKEAPDDVLALKAAKTGPVRIAVHYSVPEHRAAGLTDVLSDLRLTRLRSGARRWELRTDSPVEGTVALTEFMTFSSWDEYVRYYSRMTRWDTMLESLAREYHVGTVEEELQRGFPAGRSFRSDETAQTAVASPENGSAAQTIIESAPAVAPQSPAAAETIAYTDAAPPAARSAWLQRHIAHALDRAIDEMFNALDRLAGRETNGRRDSRRGEIPGTFRWDSRFQPAESSSAPSTFGTLKNGPSDSGAF